MIIKAAIATQLDLTLRTFKAAIFSGQFFETFSACAMKQNEPALVSGHIWLSPEETVSQLEKQAIRQCKTCFGKLHIHIYTVGPASGCGKIHSDGRVITLNRYTDALHIPKHMVYSYNMAMQYLKEQK